MVHLKPLLTEKSMAASQTGWFTFACAVAADKKTIANEIARHYRVTVTEVRTMTRSGKVRRVGKKMHRIVKSDWKKALVRLAKGQTIEAFGEMTKQSAQGSK